MFHIFDQVNKETVNVGFAGKVEMKGSYIDSSSEILVLFDGNDFVYIPINHIENVSVATDKEDEIQQPSSFSNAISNDDKNELTLMYILTQAKNMYTEINVANKQPIHGKITDVFKDYFIFYSPIYKTMYIAIDHLKWLIPYASQQKPFNLTDEEIQVSAASQPLVDSFERQVNSMMDQLVVFNLGEKNHHIGKIMKLNGNIIELQTARSNSTYLNLQHIKTMHQV